MLLIIYIVWAELLLAIRLRACAQRLLALGYRDGSLIFFLAALALMALWMGTGRLAPFARAAQLFLVVLLGTAAVVLVLSLGQVKAEHLLPLWSGDVPGILRSALPAFGVVGRGGWAAFLINFSTAIRLAKRLTTVPQQISTRLSFARSRGDSINERNGSISFRRATALK